MSYLFNILRKFLKVKNIVGALIFLLAGLFIGQSLKPRVYPETSSSAVFTNPHSQVLYPTEKDPEENVTLKNIINKFINDQISLGQATAISVYYRAFASGKWFGVREDDRYAPASLFKVPQMIVYFKTAQAEPEILNKPIKYLAGLDRNNKESIQPSKTLSPGTYSADELIKQMIIYSDNNAQYLLNQNIDNNFFNESYTDLGLPLPYNTDIPDYISPKAFALVFRMLYNSSYLNRAMSEKALQLLTMTEFRDGLVADLPPELKVAHKFGEKGFATIGLDNTVKLKSSEFHDCGIIYFPKNTYNLCVMTKGQDLNKLEKVVAGISRTIYQEMVKTSQ